MILLYGTTNRAKVDHMNEMLEGMDLVIEGLRDRQGEIPDVREDGTTPLENARIKALAYYDAFREPLFSCDSGLYFKEASPEDQPGLFIRRINGRELNDEQMIEYYTGLAEKYGGRLTARYDNAICFKTNSQEVLEHQGDDLSSIEFTLVSKPSSKRRKGFPLDSLAVDNGTGRYFIETGGSRRDDTNKIIGFRRFFAAYLDSVCASRRPYSK